MRQITRGIAIGSYLASFVFAGLALADQPVSPLPSSPHGNDVKSASGMIGVVIQVAAERVGEPAALYITQVRENGPAHEAGLKHGDEIVGINGTSVAGKSYEQVVSMIRGEAGTPVKLEVKGIRELSVMRVPGDKFSEGRAGSRGGGQSSEKPRP